MEAYRFYINGVNAFYQLDYQTAGDMFLQAIALDSTFAPSTLYLSLTYANQSLYEQAKYWCLRAYSKIDLMPHLQKLYTNWLYAIYFETPYEEIKYLKKLLENDDQLSAVYYILGDSYLKIYQYDKAIPAYERSLEIRNKWGVGPLWVFSYTDLGDAYHACGRYRLERKLYKKAEQDFPDNTELLYNQAVLSLTLGKKQDANIYIEKFKSISRENSWSESRITSNIAGIYSDSGLHDIAEEYYQKALSLEPQNPQRIHNLARFLIDKDRDVIKGMELADKVLEMEPDNYSVFDTKGWGLYKQGRYQEALEILQKSWELRRQKAVYNHEAYLNLEAAKKAIADNAQN